MLAKHPLLSGAFCVAPQERVNKLKVSTTVRTILVVLNTAGTGRNLSTDCRERAADVFGSRSSTTSEQDVNDAIDYCSSGDDFFGFGGHMTYFFE